MGITIDFVQAARRLRPSTEHRTNEITGTFKADARVALSALGSKAQALENLIRALDRSGHDVSALEAQLRELKSLVLMAGARLDSL